MQAYPLKFRPIYKQRIWGGQRLRSFFGRDIPPDEKIGESWELADLPDDKSEIINGPLTDKTIDQVMGLHAPAVTGRKDYSGPFPLLIKFLDAQDILSVQVHPSAETCRRMGKGVPKTECWYIVDADKDAFIYKGLKEKVTKRQLKAAIAAGNCEKLLRKIPVSSGQCHFLPAGTCHAIGAGLLIAEIQTPSDTTYRLFDFNRLDETGKSRPLHIEEALESIDFNQSAAQPAATSVGRLVDSDVFKVDKGHQTERCQVLLSAGCMRVLIILTGSGRIVTGHNDTTEFKKGDTILIPAAFEAVLVFSKDCEYLTVTV